MSTLLTTGSSNGKKHRCNARCYNARGPICICCCGGRNHGIGLDQAIQNMNDDVDEILKTYQEAHEGTEIHAQLMLF